MKIAICHTDFRVYWPPRLAALAEFLEKKDAFLNVIEIAGHGSPYSFAGKASHERFPCPWTCLFPDKRMEDIPPRVASVHLYEELETLSPDVVIAGAIAFPSGATAVRWARERKRPVIIMDDVRVKDVPRSDLVNWVKRRIYANIDALFTSAPDHVADYKFWGVSEEKMFFSVNVVDNTFFKVRSENARQNASAIRNKYNLPERFILGVGRQIPKKNSGTLIKAFCAAVQEIKNDGWGLVLIGDGPDNPLLKKIAAESNARVLLLPFQDQETICQFYGLAECFVLPSIYGETWGNVANESMASSLPIIISRECGCADTLVRDDYNGWRFDPHDQAQLKQLLAKFMRLPDSERKKMGERSLAIIADWDLDRFYKSAWQAVQYCMKQPARGYASPVIDRIILNLWKGRYRPV